MGFGCESVGYQQNGDMEMKNYSVVLVLFKEEELRIYEVIADSPLDAFQKAVLNDKNDYPDRQWNEAKGAYHVLCGTCTNVWG